MQRFLFFSKSMYDEAPRIRHQLADLLMSYGHAVIFYQKPLFIFGKFDILANKKINEQLEIRQTRQLVHHQLRVFNWIARLNAAYERRSINRSLGDVGESDVIINFNYDYFFLRKIFKNNNIITIINDDFVAQAKFFSGYHVDKSLKKTAQQSNVVLTVSTPLLQQSLLHTSATKLFLPWAADPYKKPKEDAKKNSILLWAHIDHRIDFDLLEYLLSSNPELYFYIVGPSSEKVKNKINNFLLKHSNIIILGPTKLEDLPLSKFFASIIPYKSGVGDIEAVTASNKTFQLMSFGLPLVTYGMPHFLEHPAIFKAKNYQEFTIFLYTAKEKFRHLQKDIKKLIDDNQNKARYTAIMEIVNKEIFDHV